MDLPVLPPVSPMLAKAMPSLPPGDGWLFEPKWDGFRSIVFRDGDAVELGSRNERPLTRYFPELVEALKDGLPSRCVVDGEIVVAVDGRLAFDALQNRLHPAASRVKLLAATTPASFVAFDLLAFDGNDVRGRPGAERRRLLERALDGCEARTGGRVRITPSTTDRTVAEDWFDRFEGVGCDGIVAKRLDGAYVEDKRVMVKVKHQRTADCVVAGFRWHKHGGVVGSLLLGLYDGEGTLHHVGVTASFTMERRRQLVDELAPYREGAAVDHPWGEWAAMAAAAEEGGQRLPGATSRWNAGKDLSWVPLRAELVCEVAYDHLQGDRFRHATTFQRWRPDRDPRSCTYDQLEVATPATLEDVFAAG